MRPLRFAHYLLVSFLMFVTVASSQVPVATSQTFGSYGGGPDVINLGNLNIHLAVPIRHKAGRGTDFDQTLTYDSSVWTPVISGSTMKWMPVSSVNLSPIPGWQGLLPAGQSYITYSVKYAGPNRITCNGTTYFQYETWNYGGFYYYDVNGFQHNFQHVGWTYTDYFGQPYPGCGPALGFSPSSSQQSYLSTDSSGFTMNAIPSVNTNVTAWIVDKNGTTLKPPVISNPSVNSQTTTDSNGNQITSTNGSYTDTFGQNVLNVTGTAPTSTTLSYIAPSGAVATYTVKYTSYTIQTKFLCTSPSDYGPLAQNLVSEIDLPDGSKYLFDYEITPSDTHTPHYRTGRISSITLPSDGTITYTYNNGNLTSPAASGGIVCADGSTAGIIRTTTPPGGTWTYARGGTSPAYTTTVTDPQSNQTLLQFQEDSSLQTGSLFETQRKTYNGSITSGTLLQNVITCYNGNTTACPTTNVSYPITQRNVTSQFGTSGLQGLQKYIYNSNGLLTEEDDYDYSAGSPTTILRKSFTTYASLSNGIVDKPASLITCTASGTDPSCGGAGTPVSKTTYTYDQGTPSVSSGTPQHIGVTGSRGNLTTTSFSISSSAALTKTSTYWDTGMLNTTTDVNGGVITYIYSNATSTCGNTFPTGVTEAVTTLQISFTWNCVGGVQNSSTDENGKTTSSTFINDSFYWRPDSTTDPTGAVTTFCYGVMTSGICSANHNQIEAVLPVVSGSVTVDSLTTLDGFGRQFLTQFRQTPSSTNFDTKELDYDVAARFWKTRIPFSATEGQSNSSSPATTTSYDGLNRPIQIVDAGGGTSTFAYPQNDVSVSVASPTGENPKRRQLEYDGLGHLTSVCEQTSMSGSGTCAQQTPVTGYWTKYVYNAAGNLIAVTQNAQSSTGMQTRSYSYDWMGRLASETNPESGTTTYVYDSDSTCNVTFHGDLVKRVDAVGNVTCFSYDALHRLLSKTYPSGAYASVTPRKFFVYDVATVNGIAMANAKGRLAEAYTCSASSCTTKITDEGFSYSARGDISDQYQNSPNSGGYYHASYTYFANGAMKTISGLASLPTFTYALDPEGRISALSDSTGKNVLASTTYNTASQPTLITLGSNDSDAYTFDPNTSRMTKYQFNVNGAAFVGNLTWNANGTLGTLGITDPFNAADTQTCNFIHDDLVRVASTSCGTLWSQTFSYDAFGNVSKSGSMSFLPTYNSATNRMTSIPGFTPTYDANGNVLANSAHVYTWDSDGKFASVDGISCTFDAFGQMIEVGYPTEVVFLLNGSQVVYKGQLARSGEFILPGGGKALYDEANGGLFGYDHADHLGSIRLVTSPNRTFSSSQAYAPFGEMYAISANTVDVGFAGGNATFGLNEYDFPAREYSNQGRWVSPDPAGLAAVDPTNPQSWNRYAYVLNNPLTTTDPTGLDGNCNTFNETYEGSGSWFPCDNPLSYAGVDPNAPGPQTICGPVPIYCVDNSVTGAPPVPGSQPFALMDDMGNTILSGCTLPTGTANVQTNCGYQFGDNLKKIPGWYINESNLALTTTTEVGGVRLNIYTDPYSGWGLTAYSFGITVPSSVSLGVLLSANQACDAANQILTVYQATHTGVPTSLINSAINSCSGNKSSSTAGSATTNAVNKYFYGP
jgi:RHS repeat-associated protein